MRKNIFGEYTAKPFSDKFALPILPDQKEQKKLRKQEKCSHEHFNVRCAICDKLLGSETSYTHEPHVHEDEVMI